ncbi:unnamed protein product [Ambrosiozyma monospora]|uniref:Unnamed protein product n=1 Tax=Ambrosiozyma monospora TaxID=43982 RepID=A0A9W6YU57_AMBMO|nr:unnamed protein product [Ambrosiozyma monospora]
MSSHNKIQTDINSMLRNYTHITSDLPVELKQEIVALSLGFLGNYNIFQKIDEDSENRWNYYLNAINFTSGKPNICINITKYDFCVLLILKPRVKVLYLHAFHNVLDEKFSLFEQFSNCTLQKLSVTLSGPLVFQESMALESQLDVNLIGYLVEKFSPSQFIFEETALANTHSDLIWKDYPWVEKISRYEEPLSGDHIERLIYYKKKFKNLHTIQITVYSLDFDCEEIFQQFGELVQLYDKIVLRLLAYEGCTVTSRFIEFIDKYRDNIELILSLCTAPTGFYKDKLLNRVLCINKLFIVGKNSEVYETSAENKKDLNLISNSLIIHSIFFYVSHLKDIELCSDHIKSLDIACQTCENFDISGLKKLCRLCISYSIFPNDRTIVETIPQTVTDLGLFSTIPPDDEAVSIPKYVQRFRCIFEQIRGFNFKSSPHVTMMLLKFEDITKIRYDDSRWMHIPDTVSSILLRGELNIEPEGLDDILGISIPETIKEIEVSIDIFKMRYGQIFVNKRRTYCDRDDNEDSKDGEYDEDCNWIYVKIGTTTMVNFVLPNSHDESISILLDHEIENNVTCHMENSGKRFKKYTDGKGNSYLMK